MKRILFVLLASVFLYSCGGKKFEKSPVDIMIRDLSAEKSFTIILFDMDVEGTFFKTYKHKYQLIKDRSDAPEVTETDWKEVSEDFFMKNENNMGMEIASKNKEGKIIKTASPPGYSNYIGNAEYGTWKEKSDGTSFWEFYGKYAMLSSVFNLMTYPAHYSYWNDYRGSYYGRSGYYGPTSGNRRTYGTNSNYNSKTASKSRWNTKASNQSFKNRVNSSTPRSTRSGSRYNSSSSRSRSFGGFGK